MGANVVYIDKSAIANLQQFLTSEDIIQQLDSAYSKDDHEGSHRLAHSLKSTNANVGALPLSELASEIEELARERQLNGNDARLAALRHCFDQTRLAIQSLDFMRQRTT